MFYYFIFIFIFILLFPFSTEPVKAHHKPTFGFAGTAEPILTNPASTIPKGHWGIGIRTEYVNFNEFSDDALKFFAKKRQFVHRTQHFLSPAVIAAYGITDDFTLAVRLPYNLQSGITDGLLNKNEVPFLIDRGTSDGLGDLAFFAQYRFLNLKDKAFEPAALYGINIPSGLAHVKDNIGKRFGADHQPSKRSFDPIIGLSVTKRFGHKLSVDSNYIFTKAVKGIQNFDEGDLHNYNVAISYRFLEAHHHHDGHDHAHIHEHVHRYGPYGEEMYAHTHIHKHKWYSNFGADAIIELNGEWRQKQVFGTRQLFGFKDEDSGGSIVYFFRLAVGEKWSAYVSYGLPIVRDPSGDGPKTDFRMLFGVSKSF